MPRRSFELYRMKFRRCLSAFICFCFTLQISGYSQTISTPALPASPEAFAIPQEFGTIRSFDQSLPSNSASPVIFHIQDAHGSYDAQVNIKQIIGHLVQNYGVSSVLVEGASEQLDPELFKFFPDSHLNLEIADRLAQKGELSGAELFLLDANSNSVTAQGVEDAGHYARNLTTFREVMKQKPFVQKSLNILKREIELLSSRAFKHDLRVFFKEWQMWRRNQQPLSEYLFAIQKTAEKQLSMDLTNSRYQFEYPMLVRYFKAKSVESKINKTEVSNEQKRLLDFLRSQSISPGLIQDLNSWNIEKSSFPNKGYFSRALLVRLYREASPYGFKFDQFPALTAFWTLAVLQSEIEGKVLFFEIERITDQIFLSFISDQKERELVQVFLNTLLLEKLLSLELNREEYLNVIQFPNATRLETLTGDLMSIADEIGIDLSKNRHRHAQLEKLAAIREKAVRFYREALEREPFLVAKTKEAVSSRSLSSTVLITGGFHSSALKNQFLKDGFRYIEITPRISSLIDIDRIYIEAALERDQIPQERRMVSDSLVGNMDYRVGQLNAVAREIAWPDASLGEYARTFNGGPYARTFGVQSRVVGMPNGNKTLEFFVSRDLSVRSEMRSSGVSTDVPAFQKRLVEGVGEENPDWLRLNLIAGILLDQVSKGVVSIARDFVVARAVDVFNAFGVPAHETQADGSKTDWRKIEGLIDRLADLGLINWDSSRQILQLAVSPKVLAVKTDNPFYIKNDFEKALADLAEHKDIARPAFTRLIREYAEAIDLWYAVYPVESKWPVLRAVQLLDAQEKQMLAGFIKEEETVRRSNLGDTILLMLKQHDDLPHWAETHVPHLVGRTINYISPETWYAAGGLGRVGQYHTASMMRLGGGKIGLSTMEPFYPYKVSPQDENTLESINYAALPVPVENLTELPYELEITVKRRKVKAKVLKGVNRYGITVYLIQDPDEYFTKLLYRYGQHGAADKKEFIEFFDRAAVELARMEEIETVTRSGTQYKPSINWLQDGQSGPFAVFKLLREAEGDPVLIHMGVFPTTHTYNNRGVEDKEFPDGMAIPPRYRKFFDRMGGDFDPTSAGLRASKGRFDMKGRGNAVSAVHRDEMAHIDPTVELVAITNGDRREESSEVAREIFVELFPKENYELITPEQVVALKREAKRRFSYDPDLAVLDPEIKNLDPEEIVISYSGRLVPEKAGRNRAFTNENLERLVRAGAQIVIFGNIQSGTRAMFDDLKALQHRLNQIKPEENQTHPGRLIVVSGWGIPEQRKLMAATDVQMQDSNRRTGAAEYTEADISASAGIQMGPAFLEGIIQRQGIVLNRQIPGSGNTIIPAGTSPDDYWDAFKWAIDMFHNDRSHLASYQAVSVPLSGILDSDLTGAEYLREFDRVVVEREESVSELLRGHEAEKLKVRFKKEIRIHGRHYVNQRVATIHASFPGQGIDINHWDFYVHWGVQNDLPWKTTPLSASVAKIQDNSGTRLEISLKLDRHLEVPALEPGKHIQYKIVALPKGTKVGDAPPESWDAERVAVWSGRNFENHGFTESAEPFDERTVSTPGRSELRLSGPERAVLVMLDNLLPSGIPADAAYGLFAPKLPEQKSQMIPLETASAYPAFVRELSSLFNIRPSVVLSGREEDQIVARHLQNPLIIKAILSSSENLEVNIAEAEPDFKDIFEKQVISALDPQEKEKVSRRIRITKAPFLGIASEKGEDGAGVVVAKSLDQVNVLDKRIPALIANLDGLETAEAGELVVPILFSAAALGALAHGRQVSTDQIEAQLARKLNELGVQVNFENGRIIGTILAEKMHAWLEAHRSETRMKQSA